MNWLPALLLGILYPNGGGNIFEKTEPPRSGTDKFQSPKAYNPPDPVKYPDDYCQNFDENEEFDFVVVGSGPGGSVVSRRLAEDPKIKVLLIEAGTNPPKISDVPEDAKFVGIDHRWNFHTVNDEGLCGVKNDDKGCPMTPGKVLGGSSIVNRMLYVRGNRYDYDIWAKLGCTGWSYNDMLPYFKKHEKYSVYPLVPQFAAKLLKGQKVASTKYHGTEGPLHHSKFIEDPQSYTLRNSLIQAQNEVGIKFNVDINGDSQMGVTNLGGMVDRLGYRNSIVKAYLLNLPDNLKVCTNSLAMKVELEDKKVVGVQFRYNGTGTVKNLKAKAKREYIISCGPLNTPLLLERSGIGRRDVLEKVGVPVLHELQGVGENYQDHVPARMMFKIDTLSDAVTNPFSDDLSSMMTFINTTDPSSSVSDVQFIVRNLDTKIPKGTADYDESAIQFNEIIEKGHAILQFGVVHLRHQNPGSIHITQAEDPNITPELRTNLFTSDIEKERIVKGVHLARKLMQTEPMKKHNPEPVVIKRCQHHKFNSEEEIICQAKALVSSLYHQGGVTAMGPKDNPNSVVDPELRVIGLENMRIVDSGVMPLVTRGNTEIPTVSIAEKAADLIKKSIK